ncbi:hypothetical protein ACH4MG_27285 [Streptomyces sp. NPDC017454]|uniref:hypothetical protein n=1 Tax=Streptomyces sp. NPDC017454 TaxID=3364997 RepID=UPI003796DEFF
MTSPTETPTPSPTVHLSALAAALKAGDRATLARVFGELADESLALADLAPTRSLYDDLGRLHETFHYLATEQSAAPQPKRRWFR